MNELTVVTGGGIALNSLAEIKEAAQMVAASGLTPKGMERVETICTAILFGKELGLGVMSSLQNIAVINGRPCLWGDAMIGLVESSGLLMDICETIDGQGDSRTATCTVQRKGRSPNTQIFSVADAKRAGLWNKQGPWCQYPDRMLALRARGFALRNVFSDVLKGLALAEEVRDQDAIDVTPQPVAPAPMDEDKKSAVLKAAILKLAFLRCMDVDALDTCLVDGVGKTLADMTPKELAKAHSYLQQLPVEVEEVAAPKTTQEPELVRPSYWDHPDVVALRELITDQDADDLCRWASAGKATKRMFSDRARTIAAVGEVA